ncbi:hypothetical protein BX666DRAFT_1815685, partial [Dichotomocladium elegans]
IVTPKETRQGRHIIKDLLIAPLPDDESLCPVQAFNALLNHPGRSGSNHLWVNSRNPAQPLAVNTISAYLRAILAKSPSAVVAGPRLPSLHSVTSDTALRHGIPLKDILLMGNWSSTSVFQQHYRHSQQTAHNISEAVL